MLETFIEFSFEAAHKVPPYSGVHGHTFKATVYLNGERDPIFGWTHNLYDLEAVIGGLKQQLDNSYLNEIDGLEVPSLENVAVWIWDRLDNQVAGLDRIMLRRGLDGAGEGCCYSGRTMRDAA